MKYAPLLALAICPAMALAAPGELTPMAGYCVEALVDSRPLIASSMMGTTAEVVGRGDADERTEFFTVPHEKLVFSRLEIAGLSACVVFPDAGGEGWNEASVTAHMERLGLVPAPACGTEEQAVWFTSLTNLKRHGVTAVLATENGVVSEILAYETPELTRPSDCKSEGAE